MKYAGKWWNNKNIELVDIDGDIYALNGWNGEAFTHCWKCEGEYWMDASKEEYTLVPECNSSGEIYNYSVFKM